MPVSLCLNSEPIYCALHSMSQSVCQSVLSPSTRHYLAALRKHWDKAVIVKCVDSIKNHAVLRSQLILIILLHLHLAPFTCINDSVPSVWHINICPCAITCGYYLWILPMDITYGYLCEIVL